MTKEEIEKQLNNLNNKLNIILLNLNSLVFKPQREILFFDYLEEWFNLFKKPYLKASSLNNLRFVINKHIKPHIKNKLIHEYDYIEITVALNEILSSRMKEYTYQVYYAVFAEALKGKLIKDNIMLNVKKVNHKRQHGHSLSSDELNKFLQVIKNNKMEKLYYFYLYSGVRKSEALNIKKEDINFERKYIKIHGTKTKNAERILPMFNNLYNLLKTIDINGEYIFPYTTNAVKCNFDRMARKYKFNFTIHDLRHTFISQCYEKNIKLRTIQKWVGHSIGSNITETTYIHLSKEFEKDEIDKFNE